MQLKLALFTKKNQNNFQKWFLSGIGPLNTSTQLQGAITVLDLGN